MLTALVEKGRSKCELYFPLGKRSDSDSEKTYLYVTTTKLRDKFTFDNKSTQSEEETLQFEEVNEISFGIYKINYIREENLDECVIRHLELTKSDKNETRIVRHYWFPNWQDHKMANPEQVLKLALHILNCNSADVKKVRSAANSKRGYTSKIDVTLRQIGSDSKSPIVVHCSAGIGRTGCFLAILNGIQQLRSNLNVDVLAILCSLRLNRGGMVQTAEQYELIHRVLSLYADTI